VLLEKALVGHRDTLLRLSASLVRGCTQYEDPGSIDLLVKCASNRWLLVEVKTIGGNSVGVVRRALGQLYEYQYRLRPERRVNLTLAICFAKALTTPSWLLPFLTDDRAINVLWPTENGFEIHGPDTEWLRALVG
jgi:hypothetical protein